MNQEIVRHIQYGLFRHETAVFGIVAAGQFENENRVKRIRQTTH